MFSKSLQLTDHFSQALFSDNAVMHMYCTWICISLHSLLAIKINNILSNNK